jgi:hypothetical protein
METDFRTIASQSRLDEVMPGELVAGQKLSHVRLQCLTCVY